MAKYVLDWASSNTDVTFTDLKDDFYTWISKLRDGDGIFQQWIGEMNGECDFRAVVVNCSRFIWTQAWTLGDDYVKLKFFQGKK